MQKTGLGRGLSALIAERQTATADNAKAPSASVPGDRRELPLDAVRAGRYQPRTLFKEQELEELAASIAKNGIVQPILVRQTEESGRYEIVAGERRWRAAQRAGLAQIPVIILDIDDKKAMEIGLVENIQRQNLTALEEAEGYQRLIKEFKYTQDALSDILGKSRSQVSNAIRLLSLPAKVKDYLQEEKLTAGHARALLSAEPNRIEEAAAQIVQRGLNVRQTEELIKKLATLPRKNKRTKDKKPKEIIQLEELLSDSLGLIVEIETKGIKGAVLIKYETLEQLDALVAQLQSSAPMLRKKKAS